MWYPASTAMSRSRIRTSQTHEASRSRQINLGDHEAVVLVLPTSSANKDIEIVPRRHARNTIGAAALTRREAKTAELVTNGLTSRQIAAKPYLSRRAIEHHVAHIRAELSRRYPDRQPP